LSFLFLTSDGAQVPGLPMPGVFEIEQDEEISYSPSSLMQIILYPDVRSVRISVPGFIFTTEQKPIRHVKTASH